MLKKLVFRSQFFLAKSTLAVALAAASLGVQAQETVTLQLKWLPQAQFAGYYVALAKGYYKAEGLDVIIKPGGPNIAPAQTLISSQADLMVNWMADALAARETGFPVVNIAQIFNRSGLMLTCKKASGVNAAKDFKGKTLGVWFGGSEYPFINWMGQLGLRTDAELKLLNPGNYVNTRTRVLVKESDVDVKVLRQGFNVEPLVKNEAACISTMIYNEYWQLIDAGIKESEMTTFFYEEQGLATLEDGLYVLESRLQDPAFRARMAKFLKASFKGWNEAVKNPQEAAKIVVAADKSGASTVAAQQRQMENVAKLITTASTAKMGYLEPAAFKRTVKVLLSGGSAPVIRKDPGEIAYTHIIWEAAQN